VQFTIVEQTEMMAVAKRETWATPDDVSQWRSPRPITATAPTRPSAALGVVTPVAGNHSGSTVLVALAMAAGVASLAGSFMLISTITSDAPIPDYLGDYGLNDLGGGTNFQVGFVIAGVLMLVGALMLRQGPLEHRGRFGAGLVGGAGLALVPFAVFMWASADAVADRALAQAASIATAGAGGQIFESKLGAGFFVLVVAAVLGVIALAVASRYALNDGREPLNTSACVGGALACLAAAAGQLIPERGARFTDNFFNDFNSAQTVFSRVGMIAVVALGGAVGFLLASRFGLGLAVGAVSLHVWQWLSSVLGAGAYPAPPALGNPGNISGTPHIVTTIGLVAVLLFGGLSAVLAERADRTF